MQNEGVASQIREFVLMFSISKLEKWLGVNLQNSLKFNYHFCFLKKRPCQTLSKLITIFRIKKVTTDVQTHEWWEQKKCQKPVLLKSRKTKPLKSNLLEKFDDPFWHKFRQDIRLEHAWLSNYSPKESSCFFDRCVTVIEQLLICIIGNSLIFKYKYLLYSSDRLRFYDFYLSRVISKTLEYQTGSIFSYSGDII